MTNWTPTATTLPKKGSKIDWISPDGTVVTGGTYAGVWFLPGTNPMYVYYTPVFWRLSEATS